MKIIAEESGALLDWLQKMAPESSKSALRSWVKQGRVCIGERRITRSDETVKKGDIVTLGPKVQFIRKQLRCLFEDDQIIVLEKPEGLLSVATEDGLEPSVHQMLKRQYPKRMVYPVHRLDRETSGVMLFTFSKRAQEELKRQFEQHLVEKTYYAIVEGEVLPAEGTWESYLQEDDFYFVKSAPPSRGKHAVTHYQTVVAKPKHTLLKLTPKTGRKNQLRVQASEAGFPILGDKKYGAMSNPLQRMALHAQEIAFTHPISAKRMRFSLPLPETFYHLLGIKKLLSADGQTSQSD